MSRTEKVMLALTMLSAASPAFAGSEALRPR